jgi:hypothetical protein
MFPPDDLSDDTLTRRLTGEEPSSREPLSIVWPSCPSGRIGPATPLEKEPGGAILARLALPQTPTTLPEEQAYRKENPDAGSGLHADRMTKAQGLMCHLL